MELFEVVPQIKYGPFFLQNLLTKIAVIKKNLSKYDVYYPYTIHDGERADTIAYDYYGSSKYTWLIYVCNDITDPYYGWPLTFRQFHDYLRQKYGYVNELKIEIKHYTYTGIGGNTETPDQVARISYPMSTATYDRLSVDDRDGWTPVYVYDWESQQNEAKREIKLLSNEFLKLVDQQVRELFNDR